MRTLLPVFALVVAGFLVVASGIRIAGELRLGEDLDVLAIIGGAVGLVALVLLILMSDSLLGGRRDAREGQDDR